MDFIYYFLKSEARAVSTDDIYCFLTTWNQEPGCFIAVYYGPQDGRHPIVVYLLIYTTDATGQPWARPRTHRWSRLPIILMGWSPVYMDSYYSRHLVSHGDRLSANLEELCRYIFIVGINLVVRLSASRGSFDFERIGVSCNDYNLESWPVQNHFWRQ